MQKQMWLNLYILNRYINLLIESNLSSSYTVYLISYNFNESGYQVF
jgi:hypothetical protein